MSYEYKTRDVLEKIVSKPAETLNTFAEGTQKITEAITHQKPLKGAKDFWHGLGPGLTTGASDDDPAGILTYSQTGAQYGTNFLWLAAFTFPLMGIIQEMCARLGLVTGRGLAGNIRRHYSRRVLLICCSLLFAANVFNIGADLGAMAQGVRLLIPQADTAVLVIVFALGTLLMQIFINYAKYAKYLKYLALVLLAYIFTAFAIKDFPWGEVLRRSITPSMSFGKDQILLICAILGTTISPYLFFWQTSQEVEEEIAEGNVTIVSRQGTNHKEIKRMRSDVWSGMLLSNLVMFFIIAVCAMTLYSHGITNIQSASDAASALRPLAGNGAYWLFAIGIIGTGLLGVPVLAGSSAYAISESFGWRAGLFYKLKHASAFYGVIIISMLVGLAMNFIGLDPIKALIYSAVINGIIAPIILVLILGLSSNQKIMGEWANGGTVKMLGWLTVIVMTISGIAAIVSLFV
jgi:NRAMP (natural resistance-associated macrophage protein)-like metal ion transporter